MAAPFGNQNAVKGKRWQQAIDRALERKSKAENIAALDELADKFLAEVEKSGMNGFKEFGDRMDGKPAQAITGADGGPVQIEKIERFIVDS